MRRPVAVVALLAAILFALTACSTPITADRLDASVGPTFARMYAEHQRRLDQPLAAHVPDGHATCYRIGPHPFSGAGDDWLCTMLYPNSAGVLKTVFYEVSVAPTGCYTADGPSGVVGPQQLQTPSGSAVNPLFAFDGCFDI